MADVPQTDSYNIAPMNGEKKAVEDVTGTSKKVINK